MNGVEPYAWLKVKAPGESGTTAFRSSPPNKATATPRLEGGHLTGSTQHAGEALNQPGKPLRRRYLVAPNAPWTCPLVKWALNSPETPDGCILSSGATVAVSSPEGP